MVIGTDGKVIARHTGATLPHAKLVYRTHGRLAPDRRNVVLYPTSYGAQHTDLEWRVSLMAPGTPVPLRVLEAVPLRSLMNQLQTTSDDPRIARVRDAYLAPFSDRASHAELLRLSREASAGGRYAPGTPGCPTPGRDLRRTSIRGR